MRAHEEARSHSPGGTGTSPNRNERIQQLRAEHQRRHRERQGQYPLDAKEEQYEKQIQEFERKVCLSQFTIIFSFLSQSLKLTQCMLTFHNNTILISFMLIQTVSRLFLFVLLPMCCVQHCTSQCHYVTNTFPVLGRYGCHFIYVDGLMQRRRNSSALAMELHLFCIKPSMWMRMCVK